MSRAQNFWQDVSAEIDHLNGIMYVDKAEGPLMDTEEAEEN